MKALKRSSSGNWSSSCGQGEKSGELAGGGEGLTK